MNRTRRFIPSPKVDSKPYVGKSSIDEVEVIEIMASPMDNNRFFDIASKFAVVIEAEHTGFGVIFTKNISPIIRELIVSPEEEAELAANNHSIVSIRVKKRIELYEQEQNHFRLNSDTVYAKILRQCSSQLRTVLENEATYDEIATEKSPLRMWKLIKKVVTRGPTSNSDKFEERSLVLDRWRRFRQNDGESVMQFQQRFQREADLLYEHRFTIGLIPMSLFPEPGVNNIYTAEVHQFLTEHFLQMDEQFAAREFIRKLEHARFFDLQTQLSNDFAAGRDNFPINLEAAFNLAFQFKSRRQLNNNNKQQQQQKKAPVDAGNVPPVIDGGVALAAVGSDGKRPSNEEIIAKGLCFHCLKPGHRSHDCIERKKENKKKTGFVGVHVGVNLDLGQVISNDCEENNNIVCATVDERIILSKVLSDDVKPNIILPESWILLDNQATVSVFRNSDLLSNIRQSKASMKVTGVGGNFETQLIGDFLPFGTVYYHPQSIGNILSFADVEDQFKISYKKGSYSVNVDGYDKSFLFNRYNKLYVMDVKNMPTLVNEGVVLPVVTVAGNKVAFTQREIEKADEARRIISILGYPSTRQFIESLNHGRILNANVTAKDVRRAEAIYGPDIAILMGKTKRKTPTSVVTPDMEAPPVTLAETTLCADIFYVNGLPFFIAISLRLSLITTKYLADKTKATLWSAVKGTIAKYHEYGFTVTELRCDGEENLSALADDLRLIGVRFNSTSKSEHEPVVERAVQTLKGTCRSIINSLPYRVCQALVVYLVYYATSCTNMFPKRGAAMDMSPRQIVLGRNIDLSIEAKIPFGSYVHVHEDNAVTNGMEPRTTGAIALGPSGNHQGGYRFLSLNTARVLTRRNWTELPMPEDIISALNAKAASEKRKGGSPDGVLRFSIQGMVLPDEEHHDVDEDTSVSIENLIGEFRHIPEGVVGHENPIEAVLDPSSADEENSVDEIEDISRDNNNGDGVYEDDLAHYGAHEFVDADVPVRSVGHDDQHVTQESGNVGPTVAGDLIDIPMSTLVTPVEESVREVVVPAHQYFTRYQKRHNNAQTAIILVQLSGKAAVITFGRVEVALSQSKELRQLHEKGAWHVVSYYSLTKQQQEQILYSFCFTKQKRDGTLKSRLVSIGSKQNGPAFEGEIIESSSPTVSSLAMFIILAEIAEASKLNAVFVVTVDIEGAYLHADMPSDRFISLDRDLSALLVEMYPDIYRPFLSTNGRLCLKLDKALYGCIESAKLFYDHISSTLKEIGFDINPYDLCVFNGEFFGSRVTVIIHVDDLLIWSVDRRGVDHVIRQLENKYHKLTSHEGPVLDYLGIELDFTMRGSVIVSAKRMVHEILAEFKDLLTHPVRTPALPGLFIVDSHSHFLDKVRSKRFHSLVAKLLYVSKHGRPDILTAVAFLTTRVVRSTEEDEMKLFRVLNYLSKYPDLTMCMNGGPGALIKAYVDASYAVHMDGKGHSGVVVIVGDAGTVHVGSKKQKMVAKSSTEAELIALGDELSPVLFANHFRKAQGYPEAPAIVFQDNQSTIALAEKGRSTSTRTRHIAIRYFFVKDNIERKDIEVQYKPTEEMLADFFTKPLQGEIFRRLRDSIMNITCTDGHK